MVKNRKSKLKTFFTSLMALVVGLAIGFIASVFIFKKELPSREMFVAQNVFVRTVKINKTASVNENVILIPKEFNISVSNNE